MDSPLDDETERVGIANLLSNKYDTLYNPVPSVKEELKNINDKIKSKLFLYNEIEHIISAQEIKYFMRTKQMEMGQTL